MSGFGGFTGSGGASHTFVSPSRNAASRLPSGRTVSPRTTGFVRVIAHRLPDGQAAKARKRKTRKASKNQHQIQAETLLSAGWITVVTSLGAEYSGEEILHLYRSRWQVELLFKRFKQDFSIHTIKAGSSAYAETETLLWLIIWTIAERQPFQAECYLAEKQECCYSVYEKCKISFIQITDILRLSWSLFVDHQFTTF